MFTRRILLLIVVLSIAILCLFNYFFGYTLLASPELIQKWFPRFGWLWLHIRDFLNLFLVSIFIISLSAFLWFYSSNIAIAVRQYRLELRLSIISSIFILTIGEVALRQIGYRPGHINYLYNPTTFVDSLIEYKGYLADENAMTYTDPLVADKLHTYLKLKNSVNPSEEDSASRMDWSKVAWDISQLTSSYFDVISAKDTSEFTNFYQAIKKKPRPDPFDSLILNYVFTPINKEGFRSIEFRKRSTKKRILFIGDSFTFGMTASNRLASFYDRRLARGYEVYNTGIIGADPPQYLAVAEKYIPLLKPDIVIINFYLGNDIQYYRQNFRPYQTYFYRSNAGALLACPFGVPMKNAREAWELDRDYNMIPIDRSLLNKVCSKLAITTLFWNAFRNVFHFETHSARYKDFLKRADAFKIDHPDANDRIPIIEKLCIDNDSKFVLSVIPSLKGDGRILKYAGDDKRLFPAQSFLRIRNLSSQTIAPMVIHTSMIEAT